MNPHIRITALILASLLGAPAYAAGAADAGPVIAEQGNTALQAIRSELAQSLGRQLREQIDLCNVDVQARKQLVAAPMPQRVEVASQAGGDVPAPHCASRREA